MYAPMVNSPITELATAIDDTQTTIEVVDGSKLPDAPNLAMIGLGENTETILYTQKDGNVLSGVTRGFQGVAKAWPQGTRVARFFAAYDQMAIQENIKTLDQSLAAHLNESVLLGNTPHGIVYEEGTFTPYFRPVSGEFQNIEYNDQYGYYIRRDNLVWVYGHLSVNGNTLNVGTASGHLRIAGLPYICRASGVMYGFIGEGPRSYRWNVDEQVIGINYGLDRKSVV